MDIKRQSWGATPDGAAVELFTLSNDQGMQASITNFGAILVSLTAPDINGTMADVVLGYDDLAGYLNNCCYFGSLVGRVANRISEARFTLDGVTYDVDKNKAKYQLHGGSRGFDKHVWDGDAVMTDDGPSVVLSYSSPDGEQGFPGTLDVTARYTLTNDGLRLDCWAETDKPTVVNLTNHSYFNLSGDCSTNILDHLATLNSRQYLPTDDIQIPTGEVADIAGTPLDFSEPTAFGARIDEPFEALEIGDGYDHFYIIDGETGVLRNAATVSHPGSGRVLEVLTTQPGVQLYTGNHMPERVDGKQGIVYGFRSGFCLETQGYTDAPNRPEFPPVSLRPGEIYTQTTEYRFSVKESGKRKG